MPLPNIQKSSNKSDGPARSGFSISPKKMASLKSKAKMSSENLVSYSMRDLESVTVQKVSPSEQSRQRRLWISLSRFCTFLIPECALKAAGMKDTHVRNAWREKVTINMFFISVMAIFLSFTVVLDDILCSVPYPFKMNRNRVASSDNLIIVNGRILDLSRNIDKVDQSFVDLLRPYAGMDVSSFFPTIYSLAFEKNSDSFRDSDMEACVDNMNPSAPLTASDKKRLVATWLSLHDELALIDEYSGKRFCPKPLKTKNGQYFYVHHGLPCMYDETFGEWLKHMYVGDVHISRREIASSDRDLVVIGSDVFDVTNYLKISLVDYTSGSRTKNFGLVNPYTSFFPSNLTRVLAQYAKGDATWFANFDPKYKKCLQKLFQAGKIAWEVPLICQFQRPALTSGILLILIIIFFKILLSSNPFSICRRKASIRPQDYVVCFLPCYTETAEMINRTLSSIASSSYPDLQKLLFIVCDGNVTGQNSKKPTPNIVLELLGNNGMGASYAKYKSTGAGSKAPNQARVYCGYYNGIAAKIPYIVVVKEGNSWEGMQPGHRGKRDSLLIAMNLFHKVGLQNPVMNPLEYELFQRMAGELHLTPSSYRYMMTIDADVELRRDSMFEMIKSFKNEKVIAVGGQVCVQNRWASALTVLQVHDYYFRNNIQKAYESTVGSITYIPDCFAAYRIKFADGRPAITDPCLLSDFSDCSTDTLHTRNMITFGEDRYLTTLIHKYFPSNRLVYARDAVCYMNVPSDLAVLTSQRRRWINSAFHNWFGILGLPRNCHFSTMVLKWRALVNIFATASAPISLATYYFVIFCASLWPDYSVALLASALLPSFYLLMLVLKGDLGQVFWSLVYLVFGLPLFHFVFPLYAFWCMDCLSPGVPRRPRATHDDHTTWDTTDGLDEMRQGHAQEEIELRPLSEWLTK